MRPNSPEEITEIIERISSGDEDAVSKLLPLVYGELRQIARSYLSKENQNQTLQATALVHEAYLRLLRDKKLRWENRAHFLAIAARAMRQILVERARARGASKRGGGCVMLTLSEAVPGDMGKSVDLLALNAALESLAVLDHKQAEIVELRFFGGLTIEETAVVLGISPATVKRGWEFSRAWLHRELTS